MKKILLLLVSGLMIVCMAGSAMADPCHVTFSKYSFGIGSPSGDSTTVTVDQYTIQGARTISVVTSDPSIEAQIIGPDGSTEWASGSNMESLVYSISCTSVGGIIYDGDNVLKSTFTLNVRHKEGTTLKTGYVYIYANEGSGYMPAVATEISGVVTAKDAGSASGTANIPEFPTVALPIAGIIGLLFIFGRKKEGL